jgi:hypothetical protein
MCPCLVAWTSRATGRHDCAGGPHQLESLATVTSSHEFPCDIAQTVTAGHFHSLPSSHPIFYGHNPKSHHSIFPRDWHPPLVFSSTINSLFCFSTSTIASCPTGRSTKIKSCYHSFFLVSTIFLQNRLHPLPSSSAFSQLRESDSVCPNPPIAKRAKHTSCHPTISTETLT